jgi:uncharacterized membrane protein YhaH (DUF805 family)
LLADDGRPVGQSYFYWRIFWLTLVFAIYAVTAGRSDSSLRIGVWAAIFTVIVGVSFFSNRRAKEFGAHGHQPEGNTTAN